MTRRSGRRVELAHAVPLDREAADEDRVAAAAVRRRAGPGCAPRSRGARAAASCGSSSAIRGSRPARRASRPATTAAPPGAARRPIPSRRSRRANSAASGAPGRRHRPAVEEVPAQDEDGREASARPYTPALATALPHRSGARPRASSPRCSTARWRSRQTPHASRALERPDRRARLRAARRRARARRSRPAIVELGGHPMVLRPGELQLTRGESVRDTALVLSRHVAAIGAADGLGGDARASSPSTPTVPVVNMLSPEHHPCQALADLLTLREAFGDARRPQAHLRRRRQQRRALARRRRRARGRRGDGRRARRPPARAGAGARADRRPRRRRRRRRRRSTPTSGSRWATTRRPRSARRAALGAYRIDDALLDRAAPGAFALHCLPAHPGEEITAEVLYGERQRIWDQAENRRHAQKALLECSRRSGRVALGRTPCQPRAHGATLRRVNPLDLVVITRARLQEVVDEAVERGRMTRGDAADLVATCSRAARRPTTCSRARAAARRAPIEAARRVAGLGPEFPITGYDDLTAAEVVARARRHERRRPAQGRATTSARTRTARRCSGRSSASWLTPLPSTGGHAQTSTRPARGAELELTVDTLAHGGNGVARLDGYVVFVAGALPGDRVRAVVGKSKRAYAEARAVEILEPSPDRIAPRRRPSRRAVAGARLRAPARGQGRAGRRRAAPDRQARRLRAGPDRPRRRAVALPQQARVLVRHGAATATLVCGFHAPGRLDEIVPLDDCLLASERGNAAREQVLAWAREQGLQRLGPPRPARPAAQPRRARGPPHRRAAGAARHLARARSTATRSRPRSTARACSGPRPPASARAPRAARRKRLAGSKRLREQLGDLEFLISPEAFFQTNTEMAEVLYGAAVELADLRGHERVFDLYCGIGTIGLSLAARAREVVGVEIVEPAVADAIDNARRNEITNAALLRRRHPPRDARPRRAGRQARRLRDRPAARRPLAEGRAPDRRGRAEADRLRLLQPDDARAERGAARRGRLRARARPPRRHVPADAAHRVRRAAGGRPGRRATPSATATGQAACASVVAAPKPRSAAAIAR